ncbi:STAS domain-containing protein [Geodermatophilus sp. FMUSA9-8]|uniref:STAS domain-containing protein n=1 Tax=Geodermatophilus sp. FMUSA9-8 TaxID=3120155 RepID=UPI003FA52776
MDVATAGRFADELGAAARGGLHPLLVDLTAVEILANAGVRVLFEYRDRFATTGHPPTLVAAAGSPAQRVLDLVGLDHQRGAQ